MHLMGRHQFKLSYIAKEVFTLAWDDTSGDSKKAYFTKTENTFLHLRESHKMVLYIWTEEETDIFRHYKR